MINENDIVKIGTVTRTHSYDGGVRIDFTQGFYEDRVDYMFVYEDGLPVPFCVTGFRFKSDNVAIYHFELIESDEVASRELVGKDVYINKEHINEEDNSEDPLSAMIGYEVSDKTAGHIGTVTDIDDKTANILFIVTGSNGNELMIPIAEEYIISIDDNAKSITLDLPDGLLNI